MSQKIVVFGANGKVGRAFIPLALEAGYQVRAFVRNAEKFVLRDDTRIDIVEGDATNAEDVHRALAEMDAVVSCLGNPNRKTLIMAKATEKIMGAAAEQPHPPRCLMISSIGVGGSSWLIKALLTMIIGRKAFGDYEAAEARVRSEEKAPWLVVRPYALNDQDSRGGAALLQSRHPHIAKAIPRSDVARFFLECVQDPELQGKCLNIGGR
ncbi:MAG: SDR family oxidoreductase [Polyangiaceae bacterium]|nr:SDR family oxidoreductase [Polyangiaceae bacterium]